VGRIDSREIGEFLLNSSRRMSFPMLINASFVEQQLACGIAIAGDGDGDRGY
jgi:hypothetical protein